MKKIVVRWLGLVATLAMVQISMAQVPAGAPAGSTGLCNDGTYYTGAKKGGACRGHQGVKQWWGTTSTSGTNGSATSGTPPSAPAAATPAATSHQAPSQPETGTTTRTAPAAPAPGGGPGMVWVNTATNVYHCPGTRYYGTTKAGTYMTEAEAAAKGARPDHGKQCNK